MTKRNRHAPIIAIACLAAGFAAAGAIGGAQIGSATMLKRGEDTLPQARHPEVISQAARGQGERLPDHYPLVTPEGTIPVAALAARGRFRGEVASWDEAPDYVAIADTGNWEYSDTEIDRLETWQPQRERPMRIETGVTVIRGNDLSEVPPKAERAVAKQARTGQADIERASDELVAPAEGSTSPSIQTN